MTSDYDPYSEAGPPQRPAEPGAGTGRRRRRASEPGDGDPAFPDYQDMGQGQPFPDQHDHGRHGSHAQPAYPDLGAYPEQHPDGERPDPQWENSGLGWDPREWAEAQNVETPFDPRRELSHQSWPEIDRRRESPADFADPAEFPPFPGHGAPDRGAPDNGGPDRFRGEPGFDAAGFDAADGMARRRPVTAFDEPDEPTRYTEPFRESDEPGESTIPPEPQRPSAAEATRVSNSAASKGAGAFGAAGIAVLIGIGAIAAAPVLAIVVGLSQIGLAVGWARTTGLMKDRRTLVLVTLIGLGATVVAYRVQSGPSAGDVGSVLGAGFVVLAADQLFRRDPGHTRHKSEALAVAVAGAAFAVLPAGYIVARNQDAKLAGASALAGAVAVLCTALVGGGSRPLGDVAGVVGAAVVGALGALSLSSPAGVKGGAIGGVAAGLLALAGAHIAERLGEEGADVRITSQVLPAAFAATGVAIAALALR